MLKDSQSCIFYRMIDFCYRPSIIGLASKICCSIHECWPDTAAKYCSTNFVLSVFPAPDSPLKMTATRDSIWLKNDRPVPDNQALINVSSLHIRVCIIGQRENMRWEFTDPLLLVELNLFPGIDRKHLIRIDRDQNATRVGLNILILKTAGNSN